MHNIRILLHCFITNEDSELSSLYVWIRIRVLLICLCNVYSIPLCPVIYCENWDMLGYTYKDTLSHIQTHFHDFAVLHTCLKRTLNEWSFNMNFIKRSICEFHKISYEMITSVRFCLSYDPLKQILIVFKVDIISTENATLSWTKRLNDI